MISLLCFHKYETKLMYYTIDKDTTSSYIVTAYEYKKCFRCGKEKITVLQVFKYLNYEEMKKIKELLKNHGVISYLQFKLGGKKDGEASYDEV